jgi:hypothetical protein
VENSNVYNSPGGSTASANPAGIGKISIADRDYFKAVVREGRG